MSDIKGAAYPLVLSLKPKVSPKSRGAAYTRRRLISGQIRYARRIMEVRHKDRKMIKRYVIRVTSFWYARRIMEVRHKDWKMKKRYVIRVSK